MVVKSLLLLASLSAVTRVALSQPNSVPNFGEDSPPDGAVFYSYPGTVFSLTIYAFDSDMNGTLQGTIKTGLSDFILSSTTGSGIEEGFNPYPITAPQWTGALPVVSMTRVNNWQNRTVIHFSFKDDTVADFRLIPDPYREIRFTLRDGNPAEQVWEERRYRIYVQLAPQYTPGCLPMVEPKTVTTQPSTLSVFVDYCPRLAMAAKSVVAVGQEFQGNIYFEDFNRDGSAACADCDQVVISVLADPGLPNGASLRHTVGGNADTQNPAEYTNLMVLRYIDPLNPAVFNHLFSRQLSFTPVEEQSVTYTVCVEAHDVPLGRKRNETMEMRTNITTQCVQLEVAMPDTQVAQAPAFAPYESLPMGPRGDPPVYHAGPKCDHKFSIVLYEAKDFDQSIVQRDQRAGFEQNVYIPIAVEDPENPLPPGAVVGPQERLEVCEDLTVDCPESARTYAVTHQVLSWTPQRGLEGREWTSCVLLRDERLSARAGLQRQCTRFHVNKCEICTQHGDTLLSIATEYRTDWLQLWGANRAIGNPYDLREIVERLDNKLKLGPLTQLAQDEPLASFARKFKVSPATIFRLNPDLDPSMSVLPAGSMVCIISEVCSQPGDARMMSTI